MNLGFFPNLKGADSELLGADARGEIVEIVAGHDPDTLDSSSVMRRSRDGLSPGRDTTLMGLSEIQRQIFRAVVRAWDSSAISRVIVLLVTSRRRRSRQSTSTWGERSLSGVFAMGSRRKWRIRVCSHCRPGLLTLTSAE